MVPDRRTRGGCAARPFSGTIPTAKADAWASNQATSTRNMAADLRRVIVHRPNSRHSLIARIACRAI